jgi:hypothetical protein
MHFPLTQTFAAPHKPILRLFGIPIDATMAILLTHVAMMAFFAISMACLSRPGADAGRIVAVGMVFDTGTFQVEKVSSLFLYPFQHNIVRQHILFVVEMLLFFFFGRSLENQIGRRSMIFYYGVLMVVPPLLLLALSRVLPVRFILDSSFYLTMVLCLSYLLCIPQVFIPDGIRPRLLTWLLVGFCTVFFIAQQAWSLLGYMAVTLTVSLLYLECIGAGNSAGILYLFRPLPVPGLDEEELRRDLPVSAGRDSRLQDSVDALLDKISHKGMKSLTAEERRFLQEAGRRLGRHE